MGFVDSGSRFAQQRLRKIRKAKAAAARELAADERARRAADPTSVPVQEPPAPSRLVDLGPARSGGLPHPAGKMRLNFVEGTDLLLPRALDIVADLDSTLRDMEADLSRLDGSHTHGGARDPIVWRYLVLRVAAVKSTYRCAAMLMRLYRRGQETGRVDHRRMRMLEIEAMIWESLLGVLTFRAELYQQCQQWHAMHGQAHPYVSETYGDRAADLVALCVAFAQRARIAARRRDGLGPAGAHPPQERTSESAPRSTP